MAGREEAGTRCGGNSAADKAHMRTFVHTCLPSNNHVISLSFSAPLLSPSDSMKRCCHLDPKFDASSLMTANASWDNERMAWRSAWLPARTRADREYLQDALTCLESRRHSLYRGDD